MYISYEAFEEKINQELKISVEKILEAIINNPKRFISVFRPTSKRQKIIQFISQSREIKFGDFMEKIVKEYLSIKGYEILNRDIINKNNEKQNIDHLFSDGKTIFMVEQKIRDDHDSSKKRGQFENFRLKYEAIKEKYKDKEINSYLWFIDPDFEKNRKFYSQSIENTFGNCEDNFYLVYGKDFFSLINMDDMWDELIQHIKKYSCLSDDVLEIPNFSKDIEVLDALVNLKSNLWKKLNSNNSSSLKIIEEYFSDGDNLKKAKEIRMKREVKNVK